MLKQLGTLVQAEFAGQQLSAVEKEEVPSHLQEREEGERSLALPADSRFFFVHLPKCAGTGALWGVWGDRPEAERVWSGLAAPYALIKHLDAAETQGKTALYGHFPYGLHLLLEGPGQPRPAYMTMLREPVARAVSHYYYHRANAGDPGHLLALSLPLELWVRQSPVGGDCMTRFLAGYEDAEPTEELLQMAMAHLRSFAFVGILEEFELSMRLLAGRLGRPLAESYRVPLNANVGHPGPADLPAPVLAAVREANARDIRLYRLALRLFWRALGEAGPGLPRDAARAGT